MQIFYKNIFWMALCLFLSVRQISVMSVPHAGAIIRFESQPNETRDISSSPFRKYGTIINEDLYLAPMNFLKKIYEGKVLFFMRSDSPLKKINEVRVDSTPLRALLSNLELIKFENATQSIYDGLKKLNSADTCAAITTVVAMATNTAWDSAGKDASFVARDVINGMRLLPFIGHHRKERDYWFTQGTYMIHGSSAQILFDNLMKLPNNVITDQLASYSRSSSHLKQLTGQEAYGIDITDEQTQKAVVGGFKTLLFQPIRSGGQTVQSLLLKPENYGVANAGDTIQHAIEFVVAQARKIPTIRSLFELESDDEPYFAKERVPQHSDTMKRALLIIKQDDPENFHQNRLEISKFGLQIVSQKLKAILNSSNDAIIQQQVTDVINSLDKEYDNMSIRIGSEVIITQQDMALAKQLIDQFVKQAGSTVHKSLELDLNSSIVVLDSNLNTSTCNQLALTMQKKIDEMRKNSSVTTNQ